MNVYDTVNKLAQEIKESEEFVSYKKYKELVKTNSEVNEMINKFQALRYEIQISAMQGLEINKDKENPYRIINKAPFINNRFKKTIWWPAWKYFNRSDLRYPQNADFWNKVEFRDFEKYLEMIFEEVLILLEESKK